MTSTRQRPRAPKGKGELLRENLLDVTEALLIELGNEAAVSIRAIAKAAGVTPPSVYLHFADKDALIMAVCRRTFGRFAEVQHKSVAGITDPVARIKARGGAYCRWGLEHPEEYRISFMNRHTKEASENDVMDLLQIAGFFDLIQDITSAVESGRLQGEPFRIAVILWAAVHGFTSLRISHPEFPWGAMEQDYEPLADALLKGLAAKS